LISLILDAEIKPIVPEKFFARMAGAAVAEDGA
jgi:hypothetical protein